MHSIKKYIKLTIYAFLYFTRILHLCIIVIRKFTSRYPAIILFYHRFADNNSKELPPKLNVKTFENQIKHLKKWYQLISLDELVDHLKTGKDFSHPYVVITIDDGFKDNYDFAFPVLKRLDIPVTIYLTTGFVGTDRAPWIEEIAYCLQGYSRETFRFEQLFPGEVFQVSNTQRKAKLWETIYEKMLYLDHEVKEHLFAKLLDKLDGANTCRGRLMLDWDEVNEMSKNQISFGAHTVTHPTLSRMFPDGAMFEISESKRHIEEKLGTSVLHFAIPNGKDDDFTAELREFCRSEGFDSVVTTNFGSVTKNSNPYSLPRVHPSERLFVFAVEVARLFIWGR